MSGVDRVIGTLLVTCLLAILTLFPFVNTAIAGNDDADQKEVGVEWVEIYYSGTNLTWQNEAAEGFYNRLGEIGWTKRFDYGNDLAWESDFEKSAVGGKDYLFIDTVDFAWFGGHGDSVEFAFSTNRDGDGVYPYVVYYPEACWGDLDLEWIARALSWRKPASCLYTL